MKHAALIASLLLSGQALASGAPACTLDIDEIPPAGTTQVWSPLFQASWEKLIELQGGKLEKVVPPNALIAKLEEFEWQAEEVMPEDGYAVYAGPATQEFVRETAASIKEEFELFEEGARVRVDTGIGLEPFGEPPKPPPVIPRNFVCDRPFYVFLWRAGADWPYLAAWIDGGDSLTAFSH